MDQSEQRQGFNRQNTIVFCISGKSHNSDDRRFVVLLGWKARPARSRFGSICRKPFSIRMP